ncbi:hypothetical protein AB0B85_11530 [Micromonospora sp. NPDC049044]|uniref:hypothetical protein n=1 Tax=unclassified Micromonospora TaxID=2617518 RepID=UPI0033E02545
MSEWDRLRDAMRATERPEAVLDLDLVMREGRRLRTRRRILGAGAGTFAAALVAVVVVGVVARPGDPPAPERPPPAAVAGPSAGVSPTVPDPLEPTVAGDEPPPKPLGQVIDTGVRYGTDRRVYYVVGVSVPRAPKVTIGLAAGRQAPGGALTTDLLINDVEGADRSPGFHEIGYDESSSTTPVPTFGYFVGPAHRITGTVGGRQVDARLARWSFDKQVVIFWFEPTRLTPGERLDGIIARDVRGQRL